MVQPGGSIEIAIWRDPSSRRTTYELQVAESVFNCGPDVIWDLFVNENDGLGREGALQLASSMWGTEESAIGGIRGVR